MSKRFVLRNVKRTDERAIDIAIEEGIVAEVAEAGTIATVHGDEGFDGKGMYVSGGWIDLHAHAFPELTPYGDELDEIGVRQGVTTVVDAGSCGADRIAELRASGRTAATRLLAFLNVSRIGLQRVDELSRLEWIDPERAAAAAAANPDFIVGLKARMSRSVVKDSGLEPLRLARRLADRLSLPLMVHIGSAPPDVRDILGLLESGDIVTHCLHGKPNNLFGENGEPLPELLAALERGVRLDVGHGTASFSFKTAELAKKAGIRPDTISTDIYRGNRTGGPVYGMSRVLSKFLLLGWELAEIVDAVTVRPAEWLGRPELGRIRVGEAAHLTLFAVTPGRYELTDSEGETRVADRIIEAKGVFANGQFAAC
ncbi:amidohydrolase/deacetylase family metallohydrolase [Cohnella zeiphila]|uniref:Amidohydrolase/deacetylase family metallohydrolase n=1 Tax=Cohnella zeiphila TaxID=2761120 RepID=A0A7X0SVY7_9BACL|nr:amidohydrolase/deacetylase family metallohydrolase [Cohnella zeiphila]MBB6735945.1 amidohydrolase/deacetylase family metallohydrolase [Cohnella zeiphila]